MHFFSGVITGVLLAVLAAFIADTTATAENPKNSKLGSGRGEGKQIPPRHPRGNSRINRLRMDTLRTAYRGYHV